MAKRKTETHWDFMTVTEKIKIAGWYKGTEKTWQKLTMEQREKLAFVSVACAVAYPTWTPPIECVHTKCRILRGELPAIAELNAQLRGEKTNYWRFIARDNRDQLARLFKAYRSAARATGIYDMWKLGGVSIVFQGLDLS